jgi:hypothetical protein
MVNVECDILRLRRLMLVHSYIYYQMDSHVVSDDFWQVKANQLAELQAIHGTKFDFYDEAFADWDGSTGCHLPADEWVINNSHRVLNYIADGEE